MGNVAFGKYKLIAELGHGGMADVFLAVQAGPAGLGFRKLTVVKRLRQNLADDPEFIAMLVDEARIAARLNHPNVVQTNEVGNVGNQYFLAMEYLDGQPLHRMQHRSMQKVKAGEPPPVRPEHQYLILMDALAGLHHAHELLDYDGTPLEIVHRDMTPQNIFVTYEGQVKVVDFGIAKASGRSSETKQGVVKGKVRYMAPEQALAKRVTRRTDVFAVGIMMWEAAVGTRMWRDRDELQIVRALVAGELPPMPREVNPEVPEEVDAIIRKALAMDPEDRFASADEFRTAIEQYLVNSGQLVTLRRQLVPMVTALFADKRVEIRDIIEKQLAEIDDPPSSGLAVMPQESGSTSIKVPPPGRLPPDIFEGPTSTTGGTNGLATSLAQPAPSGSRSRYATVGAVVIVAALVGVGLWKRSGPPASSGAPSAASSTVALQLSAMPASARVSIDDRAFESLPVELLVARDGEPHRIRIEAEGYEPKTESLRFDRDLRATFTLNKRAEDAAGSAAPAKQAARPAAPPPPAYRVQGPAPVKSAETKVEPAASTPPPPPPQPTRMIEKPRVTLDKADPWAK